MISIFNNIIITREDPNGNKTRNIRVPVEYAHDSQIIKSFKNKAKVKQKPVIVISRTSMERDLDRVVDLNRPFLFQGKIYSQTQINDPRLTEKQKIQRAYSYDFRRNQPQPMNLGFEVKIFCQYEEDLNQILGNFIPFFNPYICISCYHPYDRSQIIRNKIIWDGNIDNELPSELDVSVLEEYNATVNFTYQTYYWYGNDKDKFSWDAVPIKHVISGAEGPSGNINDGDKPAGNQYVDPETGDIYDGRDTGGNINDGDKPGDNQFVDPDTGKIYDKDLHIIKGTFKDGFYITTPNQTIARLEELINRAKNHSQLPYHEHVYVNEDMLKEKEELDKQEIFLDNPKIKETYLDGHVPED